MSGIGITGRPLAVTPLQYLRGVGVNNSIIEV